MYFLGFAIAGLGVAASGDRSIPVFQIYGEPEGKDEIGLVHVTRLLARASLHHGHIVPHRHSHLHHLLWVETGDGDLEIDGVKHDYQPDLFWSVPPGVVHAQRSEPNTVGIAVTLSHAFLAAHVLPVLDSATRHLLTQPLVIPLEQSPRGRPEFVHAFRQLELEIRRPVGGAGRIDAIISHIIMIFALSARWLSHRRNKVFAGPDVGLISRFRELIAERYAQHEAISDYCVLLGVSENQLKRACHNAVGRAPLALVHDHLLREAKRNLIYTTMSVAEVGYALGFNDPAYFSRFFRRREGLSPREFRNKVVAESAAPGTGSAHDDGPASSARTSVEINVTS